MQVREYENLELRMEEGAVCGSQMSSARLSMACCSCPEFLAHVWLKGAPLWSASLSDSSKSPFSKRNHIKIKKKINTTKTEGISQFTQGRGWQSEEDQMTQADKAYSREHGLLKSWADCVLAFCRGSHQDWGLVWDIYRVNYDSFIKTTNNMKTRRRSCRGGIDTCLSHVCDAWGDSQSRDRQLDLVTAWNRFRNHQHNSAG